MKKSRLLGAVCVVLFSFITTSAHATLFSRLGGQAAYDDVLGITWLTDADLSGPGSWQDQIDWIASLNSGSGHLGYTDWRLASMSVAAGLPTGTTTSVIDCSSASELACRDNELGYMYYYNLTPAGDTPPTDQWTYLKGDHTIGDVTLTGIQSVYWSGTDYGSSGAWSFRFTSGRQFNIGKYNFNHGWAVRAGDVGVIPIPAAAWLFGSGLIGLVGLARHKR